MGIFGRKKTKSEPPPPEMAGPREQRARETDERRPAVESLLKAIGEGDIREIGKLLDSRIDVNGHGAYGTTPLGKAISKAHYQDSTADEISVTNEIVALLLERGADPNLREPDPELHQAPLHSAAYAGLTAIPLS